MVFWFLMNLWDTKDLQIWRTNQLKENFFLQERPKCSDWKWLEKPYGEDGNIKFEPAMEKKIRYAVGLRIAQQIDAWIAQLGSIQAFYEMFAQYDVDQKGKVAWKIFIKVLSRRAQIYIDHDEANRFKRFLHVNNSISYVRFAEKLPAHVAKYRESIMVQPVIHIERVAPQVKRGQPRPDAILEKQKHDNMRVVTYLRNLVQAATRYAVQRNCTLAFALKRAMSGMPNNRTVLCMEEFFAIMKASFEVRIECVEQRIVFDQILQHGYVPVESGIDVSTLFTSLLVLEIVPSACLDEKVDALSKQQNSMETLPPVSPSKNIGKHIQAKGSMVNARRLY